MIFKQYFENHSRVRLSTDNKIIHIAIKSSLGITAPVIRTRNIS